MAITNQLEEHFRTIDQFNRSNAAEVGLCLEDYVNLNQTRLKNLTVLETLFKRMSSSEEVLVPKDKMLELTLLLRDSLGFAINNRLYDEATRVFSLLNLQEELLKRQN